MDRAPVHSKSRTVALNPGRSGGEGEPRSLFFFSGLSCLSLQPSSSTQHSERVWWEEQSLPKDAHVLIPVIRKRNFVDVINLKIRDEEMVPDFLDGSTVVTRSP